MIKDDQQVSIQLLDKSFQIRCPKEKTPELQNAVSFVDREMRKIRDGGKVIGLDRIAIVALLNIAHEFLALKKLNENYMHSTTERIRDLQNKIDEVLNQTHQLDLET